MVIAAYLAVGLLAVIGVFQVALAMGAPWGEAAWGGLHGGVLPVRLRVASALAALLYPLIALYILAAVGVIDAPWLPGVGSRGMWILTGFFTLGTIANVASRSKKERWWGVVSLGLAICCGVIAAGL